MSRTPEYRVAALHKPSDSKANVGAAWVNPDGSISVVLNSFVVLNGGSDLLITLFPAKKGEPE